MRESTAQRVVLVTGPSGAGRTTAINILEDLGFEAIDNMPISLVPRLLSGPPMDRPLALGLDARNRDFGLAALLDIIERLQNDDRFEAEVLYLDAARETLIRRFSETRRRHPMAPDESAAQGIERELELLGPIRVRATTLIDTSDLSPHDLKAELHRIFTPEGKQPLALTVHSFSYKRGVPRGIDMVFDCRFLNNPYWRPELRNLDGRSEEVADYVRQDERFDPFFAHVFGLAQLLLPAHIEEGKAHLSIGFGCTGGQHRSVTVAERLAEALADQGWRVSIRHRELERRADPSARVKSG